ncbi:3-phosphoshikimate 1-carboxyvinyltransferase [Desulfofustis glycolicus]|uniref:3-phosphoshikimate 1-carboxyvinyltransferase n=1 Tax=Desulfofustis glycolicus DSM 9705 TaxID=1121409 RepID=A0A1M5UIN1_9BACT|nr:3-phosphoshikimate 1-carboxyvinyltransferase [Desulfofustis glycolicus]MCB2217460.1 3-phosphoshikimate 1-carboxyvinyltransferase [Desulfobulbaceae bacterium]SHH62932.1 3-phosphoshikimate 1-carboxyvinyltransferase [Desulfofustis glycolicus DSM 9705]
MIEIQTASGLDATITVPGSKSITQRALIAASLADGRSILRGPLTSEDTEYSSRALRALGVHLETGEDTWYVDGTGGTIGVPSEHLYLGNNGTATRFLTSVAALGVGEVIIDGDERMQQRPIAPLIEALRGWGVDIESIRGTGCPPLRIRAAGLSGGKTILPEGKSSQYLSSLLLVAPLARQPAELEVHGEILSKPYVAMTLEVMAEFGVGVEVAADFSAFRVEPARYRAREYRIEGDASGASYFWAAAAVAGGRVTVANVPVPSLQGDTMFVPLLARMGCSVQQSDFGITVESDGRLEGITVDMSAMPDVVPTLAVVAAFAEGETEISNIAHLRIKESDRLHGVCVELGKIGVHVDEYPDRMVIHGRGGKDLHGAAIDTYNDHRMAMSLAVAGLRVPGIRITGEQCVAKSFPDFWQRFAELS